MMSWIFVLQLIVCFEGLFGVEHETLCTSNACFTLHMDMVSFEKARENCTHNGGYLVTVRNQEEEDVLRSLLSQIQRQPLGEALPFWIGLKLHRENCVLADQSLRGFKWESGDQDSNYSNWEKEPQRTCTERCVTITYIVSGQNQLQWTDVSCKETAFYACAFYFKGMCRPLALVGPGKITYTAPFSEEPLRSDMQLFPLATLADISCGDEPSQDQPYSMCQARDNSYSWNVPGPFCKTGKRHCATNNGGCEHLCRQEAEEEVRCFCREGYDLDEDGLACRMKSACSVETCEHQCVVTESGHSCSCPEGFELDVNQRNCSDIDECRSRACRDHLCHNTRGSYTCECQGGYRMVGGKCVDIDECTQAGCEHSCSNSVGSFSCSCNEGFSLSADGHSCVDIDECASGPCPTECANTEGGYSCSCPRGFHAEADGSTCAPDATETSSASTENFTESLTGTTVELQHRSPHADATIPDLGNDTRGDPRSNASSVGGFANSVHFRVVVCVLGSVIPLMLLVAVTLTVALFRCRRSKKEAKKSSTADGYCWVPSGLDQRLEKLYESILTDDL